MGKTGMTLAVNETQPALSQASRINFEVEYKFVDEIRWCDYSNTHRPSQAIMRFFFKGNSRKLEFSLFRVYLI